MMRLMLKSKIHRASITDADINYEGSISIDEVLMQKADIIPYEKVNVWDISNGNRFETYAMAADRNSGKIIVNGAAARLVKVGDQIIIASFSIFDDADAQSKKPIIVLVNSENKIKTVQ